MDVLSDEYFKWIEENTIDRSINNFNFNDSRFVQIEELFLKINAYAKNNYLFDSEEYENKYIVRFNGIFFEVGVIHGEEAMYYVKRIDPKNIYSYFDINNIRDNTIRGRDNLEISYHMKNVIDEIRELNKIYAPLDKVEREVHEEIMRLTYRQ